MTEDESCSLAVVAICTTIIILAAIIASVVMRLFHV